MTRRFEMSISEVRLKNLEKWFEGEVIPQKDRSFISQLRKGAAFGERAARRFERDYGMPEYYLDNKEQKTSDTLQELVVIDVLNVQASAGSGSASDLIEIVNQLRYVPEQFYEVYRGVNPDSVQVINVKGDSMFPTFAHGDLIFVDTSVQNFDGDGVYVFTFDNYTYIKRLQKAGRELRVISDNKVLYPEPWQITGDDLNYLYIHGKVKVHQSQQLNFIG